MISFKLASQEQVRAPHGDSEKRSIEDNKRLGWVEKQRLVDQDALLKGERDRKPC